MNLETAGCLHIDWLRFWKQGRIQGDGEYAALRFLSHFPGDRDEAPGGNSLLRSDLAAFHRFESHIGLVGRGAGERASYQHSTRASVWWSFWAMARAIVSKGFVQVSVSPWFSLHQFGELLPSMRFRYPYEDQGRLRLEIPRLASAYREQYQQVVIPGAPERPASANMARFRPKMRADLAVYDPETAERHRRFLLESAGLFDPVFDLVRCRTVREACNDWPAGTEDSLRALSQRVFFGEGVEAIAEGVAQLQTEMETKRSLRKFPKGQAAND